jgi:hypothetical protein
VEKYGTARQATDGNTIRRMRFACWITKATDTHSEYLALIAIRWRQRLRERATMLRYTFTACPVIHWEPDNEYLRPKHVAEVSHK